MTDLVSSDANENAERLTSACWILWDAGSGLGLPKIIDEALSKKGFTFYSEAEYATYNYRPPEGSAMGGWRDPGGGAFVFLIDESKRKEKKYVLHVSGAREVVKNVGKIIEVLKAQTLKVERKALRTKDADEAILNEKKSPAVTRFGLIVGGYSAVLNIMSMVQLKFPAPPGLPALVVSLYDYSSVVFAIASRLLLTIVAIGYFIYVVRYVGLMLRRL